MAKFRKKIENLKRKLSKWGKVFLIFGASQLGFGCKEKASEPQKPAKVTVVPPKPIVKNPVGNSTYIVDTLDASRGGTLLLCSGKSIVRYFVENNDSYRMRLYLFVHEQKHMDNFLKGLRSVKVSPVQYAKICMHDEISANIAALLTLRYEYLTSDDKESVLKKYENSEYGYYFQAVKSKKIFPEKPDSASRDAEWSFIMNKTRDMWMRRYAPVYQPSVWRMVERYARRMGEPLSTKKQNKYYQKGLEIAYNIGGVDFSKYMDKDIELENKNFALLDQAVSLKIFKNEPDLHFNAVQKQVDDLKKEGFPITYDLVSHIYFAEGVKSVLSGISAEEIERKPEVVGVYYNKISNTLSQKEDFSNLVWATMPMDYKSYFMLKKFDRHSTEEIYKKIYTYKGLDLSQMISGLPKNIYKPSMLEYGDFCLKNRELAVMAFVDYELAKMRQNSEKAFVAPLVRKQTKEKSRKSGNQVIPLPDFTQPILIASTPEDMLEIKKCIDDFYSIPYVMRHCNTEAQKKFLETQKKAQEAKKQNMSVRRRQKGRE